MGGYNSGQFDDNQMPYPFELPKTRDETESLLVIQSDPDVTDPVQKLSNLHPLTHSFDPNDPDSMITYDLFGFVFIMLWGGNTPVPGHT